jgi:GTPase
LPHELIAAFQSTLQEARSAQLLIHVIDAADVRREEYTGQVNAVLAEIGAGKLPQLLVYNKIDRVGLQARIERDAAGDPTQVWISAERGHGLDLLTQAIAERLQLQAQRGWVRIPARAGALRAQLLAGGAVREERTEDDGTMRLLVELPPAQMAALARDPQVALSMVSPGLACATAMPYLESIRSAAHSARRRPNPRGG